MMSRGVVAQVRRAALVGTLVTSGICFAACSASPTASKSTKHPRPPSAESEIKSDWTTFFAGSTPAARKIALLQNGQSFASIIRNQSGGALAESAGASVTSVTIDSASTATVRYSLTLGGKVALSAQVGDAVLQDGIWKVGVQSFCGLLALEQVTSPACASASSGTGSPTGTA